MTYQQTYRFVEDDGMIVTVRLVFSDTYAGLEAAGTEVGVFDLESTKKDLDIKSGVFASDEVTFSIIEGAAETSEDSDAIQFVLDAQDTATLRFCGVLINPGTPIAADDFDFRGVMRPEFQAEDIRWNGADYSGAIAPLREWKCSATSFDVGHIFDTDLQALVDQIDATWISNNVADRLAYFNEIDGFYGTRQTRFCQLVGFQPMIQKLLDLVAPAGVTLTYEAGLTDLFVYPARYWCHGYVRSGYGPVYQRYCCVQPFNPQTGQPYPHKAYGGDAVQLKAGGSGNDGDMFIHWRLFKPLKEEELVSWLRYKTLAGLLYSVAAGLGMYVNVRYQTSSDIRIKFVPRSGLVSGVVFIRDASKASLDTKPVADDTTRRYIGNSWQLMREGNRQYNFDGGGFVVGRAADRALQGGELAPLTMGAPWCFIQSGAEDGGRELNAGYTPPLLPHNIAFYDSTTTRKSPGVFPVAQARYTLDGIHTGIYIRHTGRPDDHSVGVAGLPVWLPVAGAYASFNGGIAIIGATGVYPNPDHTLFEDFSDYLNAVYQNDGDFFESEYQVSCPWLNAFRSTAGGADSWKNLQLAKTLNLDNRDWVVVGIERRFRDQPSTELRLHTASRFAYSAPTEPEIPDPSGGDNIIHLLDANQRIIEPGEALIHRSRVMQIGVDGKLYYATAHHDCFDRVVGISMTDYQIVENEAPVTVQVGGRVLVEGIEFEVGKPVFLRTPAVFDGMNMSQTPLADKTAAEDLYYELGVADSETSFVFKPGRRFVFYPPLES